jgi:hypothetical protein
MSELFATGFTARLQAGAAVFQLAVKRGPELQGQICTSAGRRIGADISAPRWHRGGF